MIILPIVIVIGLIFLALPIIKSDYLVQTRKTIVRRVGLWLAVVAILFIGVFFWVRYWTVRAVSCAPVCIGENLIGRDLQGANLRNSDFIEANLRGANLSNADLYGVDFSGANLIGVNLQNANLNGTRFVGASLNRADLRGVQLGDTDLRGADLSETDWTQADLTQVHLSGVTFTNAKLVEANLRGKNLVGVSFTGADLTGADLSGADLSGSHLSSAILSGARLVGTNLGGSWLNLTNLTGADLTNANLAGTNLIGANLASANLSGSRLVDASLIGARINGANVRSADLTGVRLLANELTPIDLLTDPILQQLNDLQLTQVIADVDLAGVSFDRQTKWPIGNTSLLADMLGQRFFDYTTAPSTSNTTATGGQLPTTIAGSPAVMPLTQAIFSLFVQAGYTQTVLVDNIDTDTAFERFCTTGEVNIIMVHRPITKGEADLCATNDREPLELPIALQALVIVVNPQNNFLYDVSLPKLNEIAVATRWSDVSLDWPREEISRFVPDMTSVSFRFWAERLFGANIIAVQQAPRTNPSANSAQLVQGVVSDPYALGVLDFAYYQQNASALKLISVDGVMPNAQTVGDGTYTLAQPLFLYVDKKRLQQTPQLYTFLTFYLDQVNRVAEQAGLFPLPDATLEKAKELLATE